MSEDEDDRDRVRWRDSTSDRGERSRDHGSGPSGASVPRPRASWNPDAEVVVEARRDPAVRARSAQDALSYVERWREGALERVRAVMPPESLRIIETAARTEWIPLEHDRHVPASIIAVLGEDDAIACWRSFLKGHIQSPLFRALLSGTIRMLGTSPSTLVKVVPRAWTQAYRDVCHPRVLSRDKRRAVLGLEDVALAVLDWEPYLVSFRAFFLGFFDLCDVDGELEFEVDRRRRRCEVVWEW